MAWRMETASGLRLYACPLRFRLGEISSIRFLDPYEEAGVKIEILFETKQLAKTCRLNNMSLHRALKHAKIVPKSLFLHEVDTKNINIPNAYVLRKDTAEEILLMPWQLL
jgi:hypothetical protein